MPEYIDLTPSWQDILHTWQLIIGRSCTVINKAGAPKRGLAPIDGTGNFKRFWAEMQRMAEAADKWNEYCRSLDAEADADEQQRINEGLQP